MKARVEVYGVYDESDNLIGSEWVVWDIDYTWLFYADLRRNPIIPSPGKFPLIAGQVRRLVWRSPDAGKLHAGAGNDDRD